jgi:hypothetical protein
MDHSVSSNAEMLCAVQDATEAILCSAGKLMSLVSRRPPSRSSPLIARQLNEVVPLLLKTVRHSILQRNLVRSMPAKSPLTAYYQRYLACAFIFHPQLLDVPLDSPQAATLLRSHLEHSADFRVNKDTNYMFLSARLALLDIGIGPGPMTVPYHPLLSPATSQVEDSPFVTAPGPQSLEGKAFNREVDALAQLIKHVSSSIVETGAMSELSRLEAKDCSERMYHRLENAVRIGGRKLVDIFGTNNDSNGVRTMSQWLQSRSKSGSHTPTVKVTEDANEAELSTDVATEA